MKTKNRISQSVILLLVAVSLASCSVEYRARHPRHHTKKVIVVGMGKENFTSDSVEMVLTSNPPVNDTSPVINNKQ